MWCHTALGRVHLLLPHCRGGVHLMRLLFGLLAGVVGAPGAVHCAGVGVLALHSHLLLLLVQVSVVLSLSMSWIGRGSPMVTRRARSPHLRLLLLNTVLTSLIVVHLLAWRVVLLLSRGLLMVALRLHSGLAMARASDPAPSVGLLLSRTATPASRRIRLLHFHLEKLVR